mgnify:CR=1 FL=1
MTSNKNNQHADDDGLPQLGKMHEFFNWEREQELLRRESLSKVEQTVLKTDDDHLADKMNS